MAGSEAGNTIKGRREADQLGLEAAARHAQPGPSTLWATKTDPDAADSSGDQGRSSPEEANVEEEEVQSVLGVSINRERTRLKSPTTPSFEEADALNALEHFDYEVRAGEQDEETQQDAEIRAYAKEKVGRPLLGPSLPPPPPPWAVSLKAFEQAQTQGQPATPEDFPRDGDRVSPPPTSILPDLSFKRLLASFGLSAPSDSKPPNSQFGAEGSTASRPSRGRSSSLFSVKLPWGERSHSRSSPSSKSRQDGHQRFESSPSPMGTPQPKSTPQEAAKPDAVTQGRLSDELHRCASDSSLATFSALSTATSLGDDSRWDNVQGQVNSRMKAIKDTLQDSVIWLPSLPSINLSALRPDSTKPAEDDKKPLRAMSTVYGNDGEEAIGRPRKNSGSSLFIKGSEKAQKAHSYLDEALDRLTGDVVILGGYRGSILRSAEPPHRQLWIPVKAGLNLQRVNLEVGLNPEDEEDMEKHIFAAGMLSHIGPIDVSRRLTKRLKHCKNAQEGKLRVHDYGYDWRLSPHLLSRRLLGFLSGLKCNTDPGEARGAIVIAHSLGGLITRHAVNQRPELFAGVLYAGTPQHCVNILGTSPP
jgi:hypothetical protein